MTSSCTYILGKGSFNTGIVDDVTLLDVIVTTIPPLGCQKQSKKPYFSDNKVVTETTKLASVLILVVSK